MAFCEKVNTRPHRVTKRQPVQMLAEERLRLHPVPVVPHTIAFGTTRVVPGNTPMVTFESGQYSVPHNAAICRVRGAVCATRNTRDFLNTGSELIDPWSHAG